MKNNISKQLWTQGLVNISKLKQNFRGIGIFQPNLNMMAHIQHFLPQPNQWCKYGLLFSTSSFSSFMRYHVKVWLGDFDSSQISNIKNTFLSFLFKSSKNEYALSNFSWLKVPESSSNLGSLVIFKLRTIPILSWFYAVLQFLTIATFGF